MHSWVSRLTSKPKGGETQGTRHTRNESATNRRAAAKSSAEESTYARNARSARNGRSVRSACSARNARSARNACNANREECDGQEGRVGTEEDGTKEEFSVHLREVRIWVIPWVVTGQVKVMDH